MMSIIKIVQIEEIHANPHRYISEYPWNDKKLLALQYSILDVGLWEGIIARRVSNGYQMAFGHHRIEAAKRVGIKEVPLIIRDLSDKEMLQFMGRENGEDYATDYLVMLNAWEGAVKFLKSQRDTENFCLNQKTLQPLEVARLLGWTRINGDRDVMSPLAIACNTGHQLIEQIRTFL